MKNLIIVESPAKAKTIEKILGKGYKVVASFGHIRDLPKSKLGVDVDSDFEPKYVIPTKARKTVTNLKKMFASADNIYLATDLDREGEAIAWHIVEAVKPPKKQPIKRVVYPSITKTDVLTAMKNPRDINLDLVDAQQARRVLDRLVGYKLSPLLWKKIFKGLSAGRVQSVALRLVVEREREIEKFKPEEYWSIEADFSRKQTDIFRGKLAKVNQAEFKANEQAQVDAIKDKIETAIYEVADINSKDKSRNPNAPFITSTLQQEAYRKLKFSAKKTMTLAQKLYEGVKISGEMTGLITYMRTDSYNLSEEAMVAIREQIQKEFGADYLPLKPTVYKKKSKMAQEAHEAIRVTYPRLTPDEVAANLDKDMLRLYELIWRRTIASQMKPAKFMATTIDVLGKKDDDEFLFRANGMVMKFMGFLKVWNYPGSQGEDVVLPELKKGDDLKLEDLFCEQHFTKPPARFSEATLVKELEKNGVGRPSTYASIMTTIQSRNYVVKEEGKFVPQEVGFLVNDFLVEHFPDIVDVNFTADMENQLDEIAEGKRKWKPMIKDFYGGFAEKILEKEESISKDDTIKDQKSDEKCPKCGKDLMIKMSRFGKFLACSGFPECKFTKPVGTSAEEEKIIQEAEPCEKCGGEMVLKKGRFGSFLACANYPECKNIRSLDAGESVDCPVCKKGKLSKKRTKRGRIFYGCSEYPKCDVAVWNEPTTDICEKCGFVITKNKAGVLMCEKCNKKEREEKKKK